MRLVHAGLALALFGLSVLSPAHAQDSNLDGIRATYQDMLELFYRPLAPADLLSAGWNRLQAEATQRGAPSPGPLPDLSSDPDAAFQTFAQAYSAYVANVTWTDAAATAVESGMADSVHEGHTHVLSASQFQRFLTTVSGGQESVGLGIRYGGNPPSLVTAVAPNGPADAAGVKPGDVIVAVDGHDLQRSDLGSLSTALSGSAGSSVQLSVDRGNGRQEITVTRGNYYFPPLEARVLPDGTGYLRLTDFVVPGTQLPDGSDVLTDLDRALDDFDAQGVQDIVLDLRDNGGGSVQTADEILGRFLPETARSVYEHDQRGHESYDIASGREHARQLPLAVLLNGGSASASEITAAALHEAHRAVLVGQRTAGALASSELLPLPGGGALQIAVAAASTPETHTDIDGVGVAPDVSSTDSRSIDDYRNGRDPQLDAAVTALSGVPPPAPRQTSESGITSDQVDALLQAVLPAESAIPTNDRLTHGSRWQHMDLIHPNQLIDQNGGAPDPIALQQTIRSRGYQGSVVATYGNSPGDLPAVSVEADLYAAADGAHAAASTNDLPDLLQPVDAPVSLGDETVGYRGTWIADGTRSVTWRRGRIVLTVAYSDVPGFDRPETLVALAQAVDSLAQNLSLQ
ncbi:MAG: PDZ domain-containing protein [Chloroflexi bacterium]|nr:PDZ domain-containing protein [Chloroflexota bacterium]